MKIYLSKELGKAYFQHDMAYKDFKDLNRKTTAVKCDKAFAKKPKIWWILMWTWFNDL